MAARYPGVVTPPVNGRNIARRRILVISYGPFSGTRDKLIEALRTQGCDVVEVSNSLRYLRFRFCYVALLYINALLAYGFDFRGYLDRTWAAQWARGRANQQAVNRKENIDAVIALKQMPNHTRRRPGTLYAILTDHVNLLSKRGDDFGMPFPEQRVSASWNRYERQALQSQDRVFTLSKYVQRSLTEDYGVSQEKVALVGAGPNVDVDCERDGVVKDFAGHNVLFVGLDGVRKGLPQLLRAFARVASVVPDARLNVVGVEGRDTETVRYHGRVYGEALKALYYESQIFVLPTLREPFGIVFLEAMWSKAVCIGTRIGAIPEIIEEGVTGFLVAPNDPDELADRMIYLLSNQQRLREMAESGYRVAKEKWTWDLSAKQILQSLFPHEPFGGTASHPGPTEECWRESPEASLYLERPRATRTNVKKPIVNILSHGSPGLNNDANVLKSQFEALGFQTYVPRLSGMPIPIRRATRLTRIARRLTGRKGVLNIHLEHIRPTWISNAYLNVLVPNQEWYLDSDSALLEQIDAVLCKTRHAEAIFRNMHPEVRYIGFTSVDRHLPDQTKDFREFLHIRGQSKLKGSRTLIDVWLRHRDWPMLTIVTRDVEWLRNLNCANIRVLDRFLSSFELTRLLNGHGVHVCPSEAEGFGHCLGEALSCACVPLTTNAPPMNELVSPDFGFLAEYETAQPMYAGTRHFVEPTSLEDQIENVLRCDVRELSTRGASARLRYEVLSREFADNLKDWVDAYL